jgi:N-acyl homoserine lactone hydrolase
VPLDFPRAPHLQGAAIVVTSFFIRHSDGPILLDTGFTTGHAKAEALFHPVIRPFDDALREMGVKTVDVRAVANCHLHIDHSGNNYRFPGTPLFVQRVERDTAGTTLDYSLPEKTIAFPGARLEVIDGDAEIAPGVRIIPTPGHTDGHQSFVVDTQEGRIVIAGQAFNETSDYARALLAWRLDRDGAAHPPYAPWVARLQELDPWRVVFAHDLAIWERGT